MDPKTYAPGIFFVENLEEQKNIILTPEGDQQTEQRWALETPYVAAAVNEAKTNSDNRILDYGCGIGRVSKELLGLCPTLNVWGLDMSPTMLSSSYRYVWHPYFNAVQASGLFQMFQAGIRFDIIFSFYVLQHVLNPLEELDRIACLLKPGGVFLLLNMHGRAVPTTTGWQDDGIDLRKEISKRFVITKDIPLPMPIFGETASNAHFFVECRLK